jgi:hypothetical protein
MAEMFRYPFVGESLAVEEVHDQLIVQHAAAHQGGSMARIPLVTRDQIAEKEQAAYDACMASRARGRVGRWRGPGFE